jgi:hypothetical protein
MKKKIIYSILSVLLIAQILQTNYYVSATAIIPNPSKFNTLEEVINALVQLIRPVFLLTFLAMLIYGAFIYLTARDDENKVKSARSTMIAAIIGFTLAVFAPAIVDFVAKLLGVPGLTTT